MKESLCVIQLSMENNLYYLTAEDGGGIGDNGQNVHYSFHTDARTLGDWEQFTLCPLPNGRYRLKTCWGSHMKFRMDQKDSGASSPLRTYAQEAEEWQYFRICYLDNGKVALKTTGGYYVTATQMQDKRENPVGTEEGEEEFSLLVLEDNAMPLKEQKYLYSTLFRKIFQQNSPASKTFSTQEEPRDSKELMVMVMGTKKLRVLSSQEFAEWETAELESDEFQALMKTYQALDELAQPLNQDMLHLCQEGGCYLESPDSTVLTYMSYDCKTPVQGSLEGIKLSVTALKELLRFSMPTEGIEALVSGLIMDMYDARELYEDYEAFAAHYLSHGEEQPAGSIVSSAAGIVTADLPEDEKTQEESAKSIVQNMAERMGESPTELTGQNIKWIQEYLPLPREFKILWADIQMKNSYPSGLILTEEAFCYRASRDEIAAHNQAYPDQSCKEVYFLIRWENFYDRGFHIRVEEGKNSLYLREKMLLENCGDQFKTLLLNYHSTVESVADYVPGGESILNIGSSTSFLTAVKNPKTGKGFIAEDAEKYWEWMHMNHVMHAGKSNTKNGPDLIVSGKEVQVKIYKDLKSLLNSLLINKQLRYLDAAGKPMEIRVPKGMGTQLINALNVKFPNGVKGVMPNAFVKECMYTYNQMVSICEFGTVDSITYDALTGSINCAYPFGISFVIEYFLQTVQGVKKETAVAKALWKAAGESTFTILSYILVMQFGRSKAGKAYFHNDSLQERLADMTNSFLKTAYEGVLHAAGQPVALTDKTIRKNIGKSIKFSFMSAITSWLLHCAWDARKVLTGQSSISSYLRKLTSTAFSMVSSGMSVAAVSSIFANAAGVFVPVVGHILGFCVGAAASYATHFLVDYCGDQIIEKDDKVTQRMVNAVIGDLLYEKMLVDSEIKEFKEELNKIDFNSFLESVRTADKQEQMIRDKLKVYMNTILKKRPQIELPTAESVKELMEKTE